MLIKLLVAGAVFILVNVVVFRFCTSGAEADRESQRFEDLRAKGLI